MNKNVLPISVKATRFIKRACKKSSITVEDLVQDLILPLESEGHRPSIRYKAFMKMKKRLAMASEVHGLFKRDPELLFRIIEWADDGLQRTMQEITHVAHSLNGLYVPNYRPVLILEGDCHHGYLEDMAAVAVVTLAYAYAKNSLKG